MKNKNLDESIMNNIKLTIAISEFGKEYTMKNNGNKKNWSFSKVAILVIAIGIVIVGGVQAKNIIQDFTNREPVYTVNSISNAINDGYVENLNMDYIYSDEIGLKINSFLMSDTDINLVFDFKLNGKTNLYDKNLDFAYIIYNENNEVYHVEQGTNTNIASDFIKKNNVKLENNDIEPHFITGQNTYITRTENNVVLSALMSAKDYFPNAKHLYIRVIGIGYKNEKDKYVSLSNSEWNIELEIPDKFYSEKIAEYQLKDKANNIINLDKMLVSNTSTIFIATIKDFNIGIDNKNIISIIDENGKEYYTNAYNFDGINKNHVTCQFPVNKKMLTPKMYIKMTVNDDEYTFELVEK